jgi:hypothetical protein
MEGDGSYALVPRRWWAMTNGPDGEELEGDDLARMREAMGVEVYRIGDALHTAQAGRRGRWLNNLRAYEGRGLDSLYADAYSRSEPNEDVTYNLSRRGVHTAVAQIAGRQKPKAQFQTSGADWNIQRRARKLDKICESQLHQRQGRYQNGWELMAACLKDAAIGGDGVVKVYAAGNQVVYERKRAHELYVDPLEARSGDPQNMFDVYMMEVDKAIEEFCHVEGDDDGNRLRKLAIESAPEVANDDSRLSAQTPRVTKSVRIVEAWRLPHGDGSPGKHVFAMRGKLLFEEDWVRDGFPFVFMRWAPEADGFWSQGHIEEGAAIANEVNKNAQRLSERFRLCAQKRTYYIEGSINEEDLQANDAEVLIPVLPSFQLPNESVTSPIAPSEVQWLELNYGKYFDITGISQQAATSRKEPGVNAAVAMRTLNDLNTVNLSPQAKMYEQAFVDLAYLTVVCMREVATGKRGFTIKWRGKFFLDEIKWSEAKLDDDLYDVSVAPASSLPNDPAGRLEMVQELFSAGVITPVTFKNLLGWPDLESELNSEGAEYEYTAELLDRFVFDLDEDNDEPFNGYESPEGFIIDKQKAMIQAVSKYFEAKRRRAPQWNIDLVKQWIGELDVLIQRSQQAANVAPAGMGSPGGPAQMAAPPPPMM